MTFEIFVIKGLLSSNSKLVSFSLSSLQEEISYNRGLCNADVLDTIYRVSSGSLLQLAQRHKE